MDLEEAGGQGGLRRLGFRLQVSTCATQGANEVGVRFLRRVLLNESSSGLELSACQQCSWFLLYSGILCSTRLKLYLGAGFANCQKPASSQRDGRSSSAKQVILPFTRTQVQLDQAGLRLVTHTGVGCNIQIIHGSAHHSKQLFWKESQRHAATYWLGSGNIRRVMHHNFKSCESQGGIQLLDSDQRFHFASNQKI